MYTRYFQLSEKPFNATPDPRFQYTNRCYREAYATLLYGIRERKGFIALTGEVGTGKTTLLRRLMEEMNPAIKVVFVYNTTLSFDELVEFICVELGIPVAGLARLERLQALNRFLVAEAKRGGTVVLLLDEAQNLDAEALENLRLISNLETATDKLLQIVMVGQPELEARLADPALRQVTQRIAVRFRLEPLEDAEVEPYIDYRLRLVGRSRKELFSDRAIRKLVPFVKGLPRLINIACDNALVLAYAMDRKQVSGVMMESVLADLRLRSSERPALPGPAADRSGRRGRSTWGAVGVEAEPRRWERLRVAGLGVAVGAALALAAAALVSGPGSLTSLERLFSPGPLVERGVDWPRQLARAAVPAAGPASEEPAAPPPSEPASDASALATPPPVDVGQPAPPPAVVSSEPADPPAPVSIAPSPDERRRPPRSPAQGPGRAHVVPAGATISEIAFEHYGRHSSLALDLIHELNPRVPDLDVVGAGQTVWLPALTVDALLRRQPDGSYRLIVSSQPSPVVANRIAQAARAQGYTPVIRTREVASDHVLQRVELTALKSRAEALRAWETARRLDWLDNHRER
jgi:general secretion pathway protein A